MHGQENIKICKTLTPNTTGKEVWDGCNKDKTSD